MRNYAGTRKGINVQLQSSVQLFDISLPLKFSVFVVHFLNEFCMGMRHFQKIVLRMKLFVSL